MSHSPKYGFFDLLVDLLGIVSRVGDQRTGCTVPKGWTKDKNLLFYVKELKLKQVNALGQQDGSSFQVDGSLFIVVCNITTNKRKFRFRNSLE